MATVKPFPALRPKTDLASRVCELPYDVVSSGEANEFAAGNPLSFFHVSKPEIDLPAGTDVHGAAVYDMAAANFARLRERALQQDVTSRFYLYRQIAGNHRQVGLVAVASCQEYLDAVIKKHEFTRPDKEEDRLRHIEILNAQTGPAFLVYRAVPRLDAVFSAVTSLPAEIDFVAADGVRHSSWSISGGDQIAEIESAFKEIPSLYIADGHHRTAAAARVYQKRGGARHSGFFLTVIFPHNQVQILPYNRVLKDLNGLTAEKLLTRLENIFSIEKTDRAEPQSRHQLGLYLAGRWWRLTFRPELTNLQDSGGQRSTAAVESLDAALVQKHVLDPVFAISDPRTSKRIDFVGGIRGTGELEKLVNSGDYACAFAMFPTSIEELMAVSDAGGIMPPKSTWFEPKLRDGMFSHLI